MPQLSNAQHEQIEKLAYRLWEERGGPLGSPDEDWYRAEQELQRLDSPSQMPFSSLMLESIETGDDAGNRRTPGSAPRFRDHLKNG